MSWMDKINEATSSGGGGGGSGGVFVVHATPNGELQPGSVVGATDEESVEDIVAALTSDKIVVAYLDDPEFGFVALPFFNGAINGDSASNLSFMANMIMFIDPYTAYVVALSLDFSDNMWTMSFNNGNITLDS